MKSTFTSLAFLAVCVSASAQVSLMDQIGTNPADVSANISASQDFETANNAFDVGVIDDFTTTQAYNVSSVSAFLGGFNGFNSFGNVTGYRVEFYSTLAAATSSLTGDVGSQLISAGSASVNTSYAAAVPSSALVTLPVTISLPTASTYWLAVIPVMDFTTGQIGVGSSTFGGGFPNGINAFQVNPGGGFGLTGNQSALGINAAYSISAAPVPEPATMVALVGALGTLAARRRRKA